MNGNSLCNFALIFHSLVPQIALNRCFDANDEFRLTSFAAANTCIYYTLFDCSDWFKACLWVLLFAMSPNLKISVCLPLQDRCLDAVWISLSVCLSVRSAKSILSPFFSPIGAEICRFHLLRRIDFNFCTTQPKQFRTSSCSHCSARKANIGCQNSPKPEISNNNNWTIKKLENWSKLVKILDWIPDICD